MEILDDFLDKKTYQEIKDVMLGGDLAWFAQSGKSIPNEGERQLTHLIFSENRPTSQIFDLLKPIRDKLNVAAPIREKANLTFYDSGSGDMFHTDIYKAKNVKTSIFYITDRGATILQKDGEEIKVDARENRVVTFDANTYHKAVTHKVGHPFRVVINFNYYKAEH